MWLAGRHNSSNRLVAHQNTGEPVLGSVHELLFQSPIILFSKPPIDKQFIQGWKKEGKLCESLTLLLIQACSRCCVVLLCHLLHEMSVKLRSFWRRATHEIFWATKTCGCCCFVSCPFTLFGTLWILSAVRYCWPMLFAALSCRISHARSAVVDCNSAASAFRMYKSNGSVIKNSYNGIRKLELNAN